MRGRKPEPNHLKVVEGTFRKNRAHPERDVGLRAERLEAPSWLSDAEREVFEEVASTLYAIGLSTRLEVNLLVLYAQTAVRHRLASDLLRRMQADDKGAHAVIVRTAAGSWKRNPVVAALHAEAAELTRLGSELGLSPVARIRLGVATKDEPAGGTASFFT